MKFVRNLLSLLLTATLLCSLLPTVAFAASGTEVDPIQLTLGEIIEVPLLTPTGEWSGGKYFSFTPIEDGEYTFINYNGNSITDSRTTGESTYLFAGIPHVYYASSSWVQVIAEGRFYRRSGTDTGQYLIWNFDPKTQTLTIAPGRGDGEMEPFMESVTYFPWYSVEDSIKHVVIGEGVTSVSGHAFEAGLDGYYATLKDVSFPSTLKRIGESAFERCPSLKEITFPAALETIDEQAFELCKGLETVTFEGPTSLGWNAFELCESLEEVTVKDPNMKDFGFRPFFNSPWIRSLAAENKGAAVVNHVLIGTWKAWDKEPEDGILVIPDGVTKIAAGAVSGITTDPAGGEEGYQDNWYLVEVVIPDSVTELAEDAFFGGPFDGCIDLERVTIGDGVTTIPKGCFEDDYELRIVNFGKNVTRIGDYAFKNTWLPGDLIIPDTVVSIGKQSFQLDEVPLGASWINNPDAFGGIYSDKVYRPKDFTHRKVIMGPYLTEIGAKAFDGWKDAWENATFVIQGYDSTYAEQWARENNYSFESLGSVPTPTVAPLPATLTVSNVSTNANASKNRTGTLKVSYDGDGELSYTSSNAKITVGSNGRFTIPKNFAGTATITVKAAATERYEAAEATAKITVKRLANTITASNVTKTSAAKAQSYNLAVTQKGTGKLSYSSSSKSVKVTSAGKVTIAKNFSGRAKITITAAKAGIYNAATKTITVVVKPAKVTVGTAKNSAAGKIALTWKKAVGAEGYQIQYSTTKNFKSKKTGTTKNLKATLSKLTKGKIYYVRIRSYKKDAGGNLFSAWTSFKAVKITK